MSLPWSILRQVASAQPYPLIFATISGAHLYGFESPDSDFDLRGAHIVPAREVVGLQAIRHTIETSTDSAGLELDLVTHDALKFIQLLLKRNGYVLEQLCSPLIVHTSEAHSELLELVPELVTKHHVHHYLGFATNEWNLAVKSGRIKPLLYTYRVLLTGIHLMRTGQIVAHLPTLAADRHASEVLDLVAMKREGCERQSVSLDWDHHGRQVAALRAELEEAGRSTTIPSNPSCQAELNDLLVRLRLPD
jgi:uncharacterized protein